MFISGVFYAAFLYYAPYLPKFMLGFVFFLPIFFYMVALSCGFRSLFVAFLPIIITELLGSSLSDLIYFFLVNVSIPFSIAFLHQKDPNNIDATMKVSFHNTLLYTVFFQSLLMLSLFLLAELPKALLEILKRVQPILKLGEGDASFLFLFQLVFSVILFFYGINYFYFLMAKKLLLKRAVTIKKINIFNQYEFLNFNVDIPFLFCLWLFLVFNMSSYWSIVCLVLLALFCVPLLYLGLFSIRKKIASLKLPKVFFTMTLFFLFLLVQPMLIIVLLGLMECIMRSNPKIKTDY